jgi:hypothetical protein
MSQFVFFRDREGGPILCTQFPSRIKEGSFRLAWIAGTEVLQLQKCQAWAYVGHQEKRRRLVRELIERGQGYGTQHSAQMVVTPALDPNAAMKARDLKPYSFKKNSPATPAPRIVRTGVHIPSPDLQPVSHQLSPAWALAAVNS